MNVLRYTLRGDGPTEQRLLPILTWLLNQHLQDVELRPKYADLSQLPANRPKGLTGQLRVSVELWPCDLLFVHRDAERETVEKRIEEIAEAVSAIENAPRYVPVVPVRMSEAWLLINEKAIRQAAGNPNGRMKLKLPAVKSLERIPNPKELLEELLREASGLSGRRLKSFAHQKAMYQLAMEIDDFSPLQVLPAFQRLETDVAAFAAEWANSDAED